MSQMRFVTSDIYVPHEIVPNMASEILQGCKHPRVFASSLKIFGCLQGHRANHSKAAPSSSDSREEQRACRHETNANRAVGIMLERWALLFQKKQNSLRRISGWDARTQGKRTGWHFAVLAMG